MHTGWQRALARTGLVLLAGAFIVGGVLHFRVPGFYERIVPAYLPAHTLLVQISGVCEILGGLGVLVAGLRRWAGIGLIALLVAVFPANIEMAVHSERYADLGAAWIFYARLPLQGVLIYLVWLLCLRLRWSA